MHKPAATENNRPESNNAKQPIRWLSFRKIKPNTAPNAAPIINGKKTMPMISSTEPTAPPFTAPMIDMVVKNTTTPITSSMAASGISVFVTGPRVLYSLTIESAGAGAVASAMPPNTNVGYTGSFAIKNATEKVSDTNKNVLID